MFLAGASPRPTGWYNIANDFTAIQAIDVNGSTTLSLMSTLFIDCAILLECYKFPSMGLAPAEKQGDLKLPEKCVTARLSVVGIHSFPAGASPRPTGEYE